MSLKPGDRVVVLRSPEPWYVGRISVVLSVVRPVTLSDTWLNGAINTWPEGVMLDLAHFAYFKPANLLRIPPDDEAKRLFRETEKPIRAPAPLKETADALRDSPMSFSSEKPE